MFHYSPSLRSHGYGSYLPRRSYFPSSFDIDDAPSTAYAFEDLGYPSLPRSFVPPRIDAETRYRHALYELEAAEQEYQTHIALERQTAAIRQRAAAEAARREREIALQAEIDRISRARALQDQVEERLAPRQRGVRTRVGFDRAHRGGHALMRAIYGAADRDFVPQGHPARPETNKETLSIGDLLGLFAGVDPERQRAQRLTSPTTSRPHHPTEPQTHTQPAEHDSAEVNLSNILEFFHSIAGQARGAANGEQSTHEQNLPCRHEATRHTQPQPAEHDSGEVNLSNILEFFHSIAGQARGAAGREESTHEQSLPSRPEATHVDGKGKGKAKAEPVPERTLFESLFCDRVSGAHDQGLRDFEYAIKLSLQDRDATDIKKAHASKVSQSSRAASSSKVEDPSSSGHAASPTRNSTAPSVSAAVSEPVSPLTSIRAVRTQFSALESAFKFPSILDFDHSELAVSSNNAPVRAYEYALNGLLERLDAIESDGNEEVRDVRREVVREVERALEEVERKVKEQAPQTPVPEVTKQEAGDLESEDRGTSASQAVSPGVVHVTEVAQPVVANLPRVASEADGDIDVAISAEYELAAGDTPSGAVIAERDNAAGTTRADREVSTLSGTDTEVVSASEAEDASDSIATITPTAPAPTAVAVPVPSSSNESPSTSAAAAETFLTSLSHDQFRFPPRPAFSESSTNSGVPHDDDAVLVDNSSEGGSVTSVEDGWTAEFDA